MESKRREGRSCLEERVVCTASSQSVAELLQVGDAVKVNKRCSHHQHVEYLMRLKLKEKARQIMRTKDYILNQATGKSSLGMPEICLENTKKELVLWLDVSLDA